MKILITGGKGFIGSHLAKAFADKGHKVVIVDNLSHPAKLGGCPKARFYHADITDLPSLNKIFASEKPQVVDHHAAIASVSAKGEDLFKVNTIGTINLLNLSRQYGISKFIFASSAAVYGNSPEIPTVENANKNPISDYGISKLASEAFIKLYEKDFRTVIFRYSNVYGAGQDAGGEGGVVAIFARNVLCGKNCIVFGNGRQTRDFVFVRDVVSANVKALTKNLSGIYNISTGNETNVLQLLNLVESASDKEVPVSFVKERLSEISRSVLSNNSARQALKWEPVIPIEKGVADTVRYFSDNV